MKPLFHPQLVNDSFGDPVLYIDFLFEHRALMFDLGDIHRLPPRKILKVTHVFVSHTHMDHFVGFDRMLRISLGRDKALELFGPPGFIDQVEHKLGGYSWNLVQNYANKFTIGATEFHPNGAAKIARFRCHTGFRRENERAATMSDGVLLDDETFRVRAVHLDHKIPCMAFCLEEKQHVNVWKNRLDEMGLPTGRWLRELKLAVLGGTPETDNDPFVVRWQDDNGRHEQQFTLGELKENILRIVPGQKVAYVVDAIYHQQNAHRIRMLAQDADLAFVETYFLEQDAERAQQTYHLTARQAGELARSAAVKRLIPMHFSARYTGREDELLREADLAFTGVAQGSHMQGSRDP
jgi:ribonuclease Z